MIPHPLTLVFCWLLGVGASQAVGAVLGFAAEVTSDLFRWGLFGESAFDWSLRVLGWLGALAGAALGGMFMRLLAERDWRGAAGWAFGGQVAAMMVFRGLRLDPLSLAFAALGSAFGAWLCERERHRPGVEAAQTMLRGWMFWERGGA